MKLIANECVECGRPVGYVTKGTLQLPTLCLLCVNKSETMEEWGHSIDGGETKTIDVARDYYEVLRDILH